MKKKSFFQFSAPSIIAMGALLVFPLAIAIWLGLHLMTFRNINAPQFIGLANYVEVLTDQRFWQAFQFTILYTAVTVPIRMVIGLILALMLDQVTRRYRGVFIAIILLPMVVVPVVGTLMFKQLFEPSGIVAWFFREFMEQRFIFTETSVKSLILLHTIWTSTPFAFIVIYAGLLTLPQEQVEASLMDGANRRQQIGSIVLPHLRSILVFIALILIMDSYRVFDSVFVLTEQNPIFKADTIMLYTFRTAMTVQRLGKANAMAILTVIMILVILIPFLIRTYHDQIEER